MMTSLKLASPFDRDEFAQLRCGDVVELSGVVYTARDAAHARFAEAIAQGKPLPFDPEGQIIYYAGPSPAKPGSVIGSCGPTTSGRMDTFTPALIERGLVGMVGKGPRSAEVIASMMACGCVYFAAVGGAAALSAACIRSAEVLAYDDLGPEAVRRLLVEDYPCVVAIDSRGESIYEQGPALYRREYA